MPAHWMGSKVLGNNLFMSKTKVNLLYQRVIRSALRFLIMVLKIVFKPDDKLKVVRKLSFGQF